MDQLELNLEMVESGIARYRNKVKSAQDRGKRTVSDSCVVDYRI
jgi:hypothetical protein